MRRGSVNNILVVSLDLLQNWVDNLGVTCVCVQYEKRGGATYIRDQKRIVRLFWDEESVFFLKFSYLLREEHIAGSS